MAGSDQAGIACAGERRQRGLPFNERHLVAILGQVVGAGDADDPAADHDSFHLPENGDYG